MKNDAVELSVLLLKLIDADVVLLRCVWLTVDCWLLVVGNGCWLLDVGCLFVRVN